ncbi:MAG: 4Fe-4S binding protein [Candidatus Thorarchaeota archaeon]
MIENEKHRQNLLNIAHRLKYAWYSIPTIEKGEPTETYLEYLSIMYNPEIAELIQNLELFPNMISIVKFSKKVGMDKKELAEKLDNLTKRGFVLKLGKQYSLPTPLFVHEFPFMYAINYNSENAKTLAELAKKYFYEEEYYKKWQTTSDGTPRARILTVSEQIDPIDEIVPIEEVYTIIEQFDDFAVIPCPCRNREEINGTRRCKDRYPILNCLIVGPYAKGALEMGDPVIKAITKEDAKKLMKEASDLGLVHTTDNKGTNIRLICSCCECCCSILSGLTKLDNPRAIGRANYVAKVDEQLCVGCGTCIERCKFGAITVNEISVINIDKCMGCGLCAVTCSEEAIKMKRYEREEIPLEREEIEIL